jgi:hypothetical protein
MASFLVILRAGDYSLHPNWLTGSKDWDLAISYYGSNPHKTFPEASYMHRSRGGKWDGLYDFFNNCPEILNKYDYFWLPDDDIDTNTDTINRLFSRTERHNLELAQPSLTTDSYFSNLLTVRCRCFSVRYTSFVEIMAPVIARSVLIKVIPYLKGTQSGFGLDYMWHHLVSDPMFKVGVLDEISVFHTRPVGGNQKPFVREKELNVFLKQWDVPQHRAVAYGGRLSNGTLIRSQAICAILQFLCWSCQSFRLKWTGQGRLASIRKYYWFCRACIVSFLPAR